MTYVDQIKEAAQYIQDNVDMEIEIGMVLGSGLSTIADQIDVKYTLNNKDIPNFPLPVAPGHEATVVFGVLQNKNVMILKGRTHYYDNGDMKDITFPIRVMHLLGIKKLFLTNACGGVNESYKPGTLMVLNDHINLMANSPLIGPNLDEFGTRFPDMTYTYTPRLIELAMSYKDNLEVPLEQGVYASWFGPAYETPAEIRMIRTLGADAVGMSTVPEALVASHQQMEVIAISCITNMACGILPQKLSHDEVVETANRVKGEFIKLVNFIVKEM